MGALALDAKLCMWISALLSHFTYIAMVDKGLISLLINTEALLWK